jgi:hypothetical protein
MGTSATGPQRGNLTRRYSRWDSCCWCCFWPCFFAVHFLGIVAGILVVVWLVGFVARSGEGNRWYRW